MTLTEEMNANMDTLTVGDVVARDYRTAEVFERHGIDFCCGGTVPLGKICREKGIDPQELAREIDRVAEEPMAPSQNYASWELPFLADYIVNTHHAYLKNDMANISAYAQKIAQVHGGNHPEVIEIARIFEKIAADMQLHMREEEEVFFPAVKHLVELEKAGVARNDKELLALRDTLASLAHDHDEIGTAVHEIRALAKDYTVPDDVCNTFMVTYNKLREFEEDLHKHVHLENNILFPKAAKL